ncbi:very short patch repair endonuclease [Chryseobacterium kwangjuense]|uniref:Very short patch repair endonuclease n=2 Tax=Chryseobacterium kwangjuense TaxID=267125 RepID=A0A135WJN3_9FLAO|nr:very short patch repair endonuclease [Chryseobacterium kwangjuense]
MMDIWSKEKRSEVMSKIRGKNTKPEMILRSQLFMKGFRFRIHKKDLPGKPDIVLPKYKTVIFVHGCFWHYHKDCREGRIPSTNSKFWQEKLSKNIDRDEKYIKELQQLGWKVIVIWECEIEKNIEDTLEKLIVNIKNDNE